MRAAIFHRFSAPLVVETVDDPVCPDDGVVVEVGACGVCRSDVHAWNGSDADVCVPHVSGHEFAGTVVEIGKYCRRFEIGHRVTAPFILACGDCPDCIGGDATLCDHQQILGFTRWGAFAERVAVPRADFNLVCLPEDIGFVEAAGMGCRVSTAFRALIERACLRAGEILAVHGCGGVGLSAVMIGAALGARVIAVDIDDQPLSLAAKLGASDLLQINRLDDVSRVIREITDGGAHVSIDALGSTETFHASLRSLRKLGRHVQIGMPVKEHARPIVPLLETVYARQISILGTRGLAASRFPALLNMVASNRLRPAQLISRTIALSQTGKALQALDEFASPGVTVIDRFQS